LITLRNWNLYKSRLMITLKTDLEITKMREAGRIAARILNTLQEKSIPGVSTLELNNFAEEEILKAGMKAGFKTVEDYRFATCITVNEEVVHGLPSQYRVSKGDLVTIDLGVMNDDLHTDVATSFEVRGSDGKPISKENNDFLNTGRETLLKAISLVKDGVRVGDISSLIQSEIENHGYSIVKDLTGHGVGYELHEDPLIPGFGKKGTGPALKNGMTVAIEVIYTMGGSAIYLREDGWTIVSEDKSLAAVFEHTILVTDRGPVVLTQGGNPAKIIQSFSSSKN
jgi:methionyl aminopeptidase